MVYSLVMKKSKNNYQPFDLHLLNTNYSVEDLMSLAGIDSFTSHYKDEMALKNDLLEANFIDIDELDNELMIIFREKEKDREYEYGIWYQNNTDYFDADFIINFIYENQNNLEVLNKLYNKFVLRKEKSPYWYYILTVLKNYKEAPNKEDIKIIKFLPYEERRCLGSYIYHNFYDTITLDRNDKDGIQKIRRTN